MPMVMQCGPGGARKNQLKLLYHIRYLTPVSSIDFNSISVLDALNLPKKFELQRATFALQALGIFSSSFHYHSRSVMGGGAGS